MKNLKQQEQYKVSEGNNQQVFVLNSEVLLSEDAPVRVTSAQLEELDYRKLYEAYSSKGRKTVTDQRVLLSVFLQTPRSSMECVIPDTQAWLRLQIG